MIGENLNLRNITEKIKYLIQNIRENQPTFADRTVPISQHL